LQKSVYINESLKKILFKIFDRIGTLRIAFASTSIFFVPNIAHTALFEQYDY